MQGDCRERGDIPNICVRWVTLIPLRQTVQGSEEFTSQRRGSALEICVSRGLREKGTEGRATWLQCV